ncbi:uncharacterized protein LOC144440964 [Glandiceps talaboti]
MTRLSLLVFVLAILSAVAKGNEECHGECKGLGASGLYCASHEFEYNEASCSPMDNERCCVVDCGDMENPGTSCHPTDCPDGKVKFTGGQHKCIYPGEQCCRPKCSDDSQCKGTFSGKCTYNECGHNEVKRTDLCPSRGACHCCYPKMNGNYQGSSVPGEKLGGGIRTLDGGKTFHVDRASTYTLLRACENVHQKAWFTIVSEHYEEKSTGKVYINGIVIEISKDGRNAPDSGEMHKIEIAKFGEVQIDDNIEKLDIDKDMEDGEVHVVSESLNIWLMKIKKWVHVIMEDEFELAINVKEVFHVISWADHLRGKMCGLLGDGDGEPNNDIRMWVSGGQPVVTEDMDAFIKSWEIQK